MANEGGPKPVFVLYVIHYTYLYHHIVVLDKYTHSNLDHQFKKTLLCELSSSKSFVHLFLLVIVSGHGV